MGERKDRSGGSQLLRFTASSAFSAVLDIALFWALRHALPIGEPPLIMASTVIARCASGAVNFLINRHWSFSATDAEAHGRTSAQAGRYAILFVAKMMLSALIVSGLSRVELSLELLKAVVDIALFALSYVIERDWVYAGGRKAP